jgi:hypothetical protein
MEMLNYLTFSDITPDDLDTQTPELQLKTFSFMQICIE